jgi:hypothetical protein
MASDSKPRCGTCGFEYAPGASFCSACGRYLLDTAVEEVVRGVLCKHYRDTKFLEADTAGKIVKRVQFWANLFLFAVAVPATIAAVILGWFGISSYNEAREKCESVAKGADALQALVVEQQKKVGENEKSLNAMPQIIENAKNLDAEVQVLKSKTSQDRKLLAQVSEDQKFPPRLTSPAPPSTEAQPAPNDGENVDELFKAQRTNELALARSGRRLFEDGNYGAAIRFYEEARRDEANGSSGVWLSDYPFLATAYLFTGREDLFRQALVTAVARAGQSSGYLSFRTSVSFLLRNFGDARKAINDSPRLDNALKVRAVKAVDQAIDEVNGKLDKMSQ